MMAGAALLLVVGTAGVSAQKAAPGGRRGEAFGKLEIEPGAESLDWRAPDVGVETAQGAVPPPLPYPGQERHWRVSEAAAVAGAAAVVGVTRPRRPATCLPTS